MIQDTVTTRLNYTACQFDFCYFVRQAIQNQSIILTGFALFRSISSHHNHPQPRKNVKAPGLVLSVSPLPPPTPVSRSGVLLAQVSCATLPACLPALPPTCLKSSQAARPSSLDTPGISTARRARAGRKGSKKQARAGKNPPPHDISMRRSQP